MFDETKMVENQTQNDQQVSENQTPPAEETQKEYNLRIMRQRIAESDARAAAAEQRLLEIENRMRVQQPNNTVEDYDADDFDLEDDGYPDNKTIKKLYSKFKKDLQSTKEELSQYRQRTTAEQAEIRLKAQFPDFDQIVTSENIKRLQVMEPEEYSSMISNPDTYAKAKTAYNMIKRNNLYDKYEDVDRKIEANRMKPKSPSTVGPQTAETPLTKIGDYDRRTLTEDQKAFYRQQVENAKKYR